MKVIFIAVVGALLAVVTAATGSQPRIRHRRDSFPDAFELPSNASLLLGNIATGFDCASRPYGYYADTANACRIFHVCLPYLNYGEVIVRHFSFLCGEGTVFDQQTFVCDFPENALPCLEAPNFLYVNEYFGRTDVNFLE